LIEGLVSPYRLSGENPPQGRSRNVSEAVVYIPDDVEYDVGLNARRGIAHIERHGHKFAGVLRNAERVIRLAREGVVVVFARRAHSDSLRAEGIKRECVGEETCRLVPIVQEATERHYGQAAMRQRNGRVWMSQMAIGPQGHAARNVHRLGDEGETVRLPSAGWVRSVLSGDTPAPSGMDPEMIAAARRIAKRLHRN
jgi:hypothetical protein